MQNNNQLAPHEMLEVRELLDADIVAAKKIQASMAMVKDQELKSFMQDCLNSKKTKIQEIQQFISSQGLS